MQGKVDVFNGFDGIASGDVILVEETVGTVAIGNNCAIYYIYMTKTRKKVARKVAKKTMKKRVARKNTTGYTYDTKMSKLEKKLNLDLNIPPDTKLGDFFNKKGYQSLVRVLQML